MKKIFSILLVAALCVFAANAADEKVQVSAEKAAAALDSLAMLPDLPMQTQVVPSNVDKHPLSMAIVKPVGQPKAIVVFSHGMAEHKERYYPFMQYLAKHGYVCEMHDHRGHGGSITKKAGLGDFGTNKGAQFFNNMRTNWERRRHQKTTTQEQHSEQTRHESDWDYNRRQQEEQAEIDRILDKIRKSGYESLSKAEKQRLFDSSNRK